MAGAGAALAGLPAASQQRLPVKTDTLSRILSDMCRPGWLISPSSLSPRLAQPHPPPPHTYPRAGVLERGDEHILRDFVDAESRSYSGERFNRFVAELFSRVKALVQRLVYSLWEKKKQKTTHPPA